MGVIQVTVLGFKQQRNVIDVCASKELLRSVTVLQLKMKIEENLLRGIGGVDDFRLVFAGIQMTDADALSSYGIEHMSTIQLLMRLHGGV
ncbi:polyubiquitin-like [Lampris incognitus]|uniref:polyubiquitin-like n=1 Tax=Lampris incognitus TaxID=2546036 RepID=UPI0024B59ED4|nr:polyubiquitin-like [Lampris incognitus]